MSVPRSIGMSLKKNFHCGINSVTVFLYVPTCITDEQLISKQKQIRYFFASDFIHLNTADFNSSSMITLFSNEKTSFTELSNDNSLSLAFESCIVPV